MPSTTQEHANGSVDTDDPMKNGISFEDKEEPPQKHQQPSADASPGPSPIVQEVPPEVIIVIPSLWHFHISQTDTASDGESTPAIIEEPRDGSVKSVNSPGNPLLDRENSEGVDPLDEIEITWVLECQLVTSGVFREVGSVENATPHETFTVPVVIQSGSPRNIEVSEASVEIPITEPETMDMAPADEETPPTQDEDKRDEETPADR